MGTSDAASYWSYWIAGCFPSLISMSSIVSWSTLVSVLCQLDSLIYLSDVVFRLTDTLSHSVQATRSKRSKRSTGQERWLFYELFANSVSRILALSSHSVVRVSSSVTSLHISIIWHFRPHKPNIFWKLMTSTIYSSTTTHLLPKYKYTNTQIQLWLKLNIGITCAIFLKRLWYEDLKNNVHEYLMCKYTNTQIQKYTNTQIHK